MKNAPFRINAIATALLSTAIMPCAFADELLDQSASIEVITVLGEKIERSLKDTTSSVSVIDAEQLANGQHLSVSSAISGIANVVVLSGAVPDIRGVQGNGSASGFNSFSGGAKARVSTLVDGVSQPFVADMTGDTGLWDIEQIEVFRGPQSTSNGRNSIGGLVYIKTKDPTFDWNGATRLGYRNKDNYLDSAFMLSGPIMDDQLAFRISGQNLTGETINKGFEYETNPANFDQNEIKTNRLHTKLLWQPANIEALKVMFSYAYNNEKGDTGRNYFTGDDPWALKPLFQRYMDTKSDTSSVKFDYQLNAGQSVDLLISYIDYEWGFKSYEANPEAQSNVLMNERDISLDGKFNFGLDTPEFTGYIGLAYSKRNQDFNSRGGSIYEGDDSSISKSLYGEVSYAINDSLRIIAGGRVEKEQQVRNFEMLLRGNDIGDKLDKDNTIVLPKLVLQYAITDETTLSASARRGYNSGGGALSTIENAYYFYDEESVNTYELSARSSLFDGNVNISANLFYNNFNGYQASNTKRKITNIDKAVTSGLEFEISAMVTDDLQVKSGLGLLKTDIKSADDSFGDVLGNELNAAPNLTASLSMKYWLSDEFSMAVSSNYVDEYYADFNNTDERVAGNYAMTRINLDYQSANWLVSAFINNAFDKKARTATEPAGGRYPQGYAAIVDPRSVGVSVSYTY